MKLDKRGSFTVEAALIMPIVIFVVITLIYIIFYLHDMTYLKTQANTLSEKGAKSFVYKGRQIENGAIDYSVINDRWIYWRFTEDYGAELVQVENYASTLLEKGFFQIREEEVELTMEVDKGLLGNDFLVTLEAPFHTPFRFVNYLISQGKPISIRVDSKARVPETAEFIRNSQMIDQMTDRLTIIKEGKEKYDEGIEELKELLKEAP